MARGNGPGGSRRLPGDAPTGIGAATRRRRAAALDEWLAGLLDQARGGASSRPVSLVALGGLGRHECAPYGDLDLVLLHDTVPGVGGIAERVWYPIWDAGLALDHSVRTLAEAGTVAAGDTRAALGLLDARHIAGDETLTATLHESMLQQWRSRAGTHLPALGDLARRRWQKHGDLAFLLDGDLKEARGGLRDVRILRGVGYAQVADAWRPQVQAAYARLLDVRDALHVVAGRRRERLLAQDLPEVSTLLGLADGPDALRRRVSDDARAVAYGVDDALRAAERWLSGTRAAGTRAAGTHAAGTHAAGARTAGPRSGGGNRQRARLPLAPDVVAQDGEVVLARAAVTPTVDPTLSLRVAAAAARSGLPISRSTLEWLGRHCPPLPRPWPPAATAAMSQLLSCGSSLVSTWEACDRFGLIAGWLPEWARVRSAPQHSPVHRFTLDRHLIEAAAYASRFSREVARPDLLLLGALLHDIGKGLPGDHSVVGVELATGMAAAMGYPDAEAQLIGRLVRWHLLLPETATRRDLNDPATVRTVVTAVGDVETLDLLYALTRADAAATGPAAWSAWKERLVAGLVERVRAALRTGELPAPPEPDVRHAAMAAGPLPAVECGPGQVAVVAEPHPGLLTAVAGCLTLHRLDVLSVDACPVDAPAGRSAVVVVCQVRPRDPGPVDHQRLATDLRRAVGGELALGAALAVRTRTSERAGRIGDNVRRPAPPRVVWVGDGATDATILELRAADDVGLLYRVSRGLQAAGADVRAARISTLGTDVVDAFYLRGDWSDRAARAAVEQAVLAAAGSD